MLCGEAEALGVSLHKTEPSGGLFLVLCEFRFMIANDPEGGHAVANRQYVRPLPRRTPVIQPANCRRRFAVYWFGRSLAGQGLDNRAECLMGAGPRSDRNDTSFLAI
jgi:hypothetical protein